MQNIKKYFMTLALLLMAVGGAWADETPLVTINSTGYTTFTSGSKTFDDKVTVTFSNSVSNDGDHWGWYTDGTASLLTVAGINDYTITSCKFYTFDGTAKTGYTVAGESPSVYLNNDYVYTDDSKSENIGKFGISKIEVYGGVAPSATDPNAVTAAEINSDLYSGWSSVDEKLLKASDLPGFQAVTENQAKSWTGVPSTGRVKLFYDFVADGNVKVVIFNNGVYDSSYEENDLRCYDIYEDIKYNGDTKYFYTTGPAPSEWSLTPDETGKKWTLAEMPASNVELQVEYYAESNLFLGKEALADKANIAVKNGETDVAFDADGKSTTTVTEGTEMTVKFNGTKKVLGVKVEKKPESLIVNPEVGQVIGSDGKNYAYGSLPTGVTAVAKICYVSGSNGLALALTDEGTMNWSTAQTTCAAHTPAITGGTWKLASKDDWDNMINTAGSHTALRDGFSSVGGTNMKEDYPYWSSTEDGSDKVWIYSFSYGIWSKNNSPVGYVRACLAF